MKTLSYQTLQETGYGGYLLKDAPERVIQFGDGNFLRAFVDDFIDRMNEAAWFNAKVVMVQPRAPHAASAQRKQALNEQEGLYTLYLRGFENGEKVNTKRVISCISRCLNAYTDYEAVMACADNPDLRFIVSNTTEAGIIFDPACRLEDAPPATYPAKLTAFLYRRFQKFGAQEGKGFIILPCELIDDNGAALAHCVMEYARLWGVGAAFEAWLKAENCFCSTLVDRIVTGWPHAEADALHEENGYIDCTLNTGEVFAFWAIEGPQALEKELPFKRAGLPILLTDNCKPYKQRKVRILNGAHTAMVLGAYLAGQNIVRACMDDTVIRGFMEQAVYGEIIPTLDLPEEELRGFAHAVAERFQNPFIDHALLSIALNSTSKWKERVMPSLLAYVEQYHKLPKCLAASLAFYAAFYQGIRLEEDGLIGIRGENEYTIRDERPVLEFFATHKDDAPAAYAHAVLSNAAFWGRDLTAVPGLEAVVEGYLKQIQARGAYAVMEGLQSCS